MNAFRIVAVPEGFAVMGPRDYCYGKSADRGVLEGTCEFLNGGQLPVTLAPARERIETEAHAAHVSKIQAQGKVVA